MRKIISLIKKIPDFFDKDKVVPFLFFTPHLIIFSIFFIIPFIFGIIISLYDWNIFAMDGEFIGFENYFKILFDKESIYYEYFRNGLFNTLKFVVISVPCLVIIPLIIAILIDLEPFGAKFFRAVFYMPSLLSISTVILIWVWILNTNVGIMNYWLNKLGLASVAWLTSQPAAWIALVVITIWWTVGGNLIIFGASLKEIPQSLYEAAEIDGANYFKSVWHITLPGIKNQLLYISIMTTLASFNVFGQPQLATGGGPTESTKVLMMYIRDIAFGGGRPNPGIAMAMAVVLGCIMIFISIIQAKFFKQK